MTEWLIRHELWCLDCAWRVEGEGYELAPAVAHMQATGHRVRTNNRRAAADTVTADPLEPK